VNDEERQARNLRIIEEFRANGGTVGMFDGVPLLLLHHVGARSGAEYITPLAYLPDDGHWVVFAANGGRPNRPGWYYNLRAEPQAVTEVGTETHRVTARLARPEERAPLMERQKLVTPYLDDFEKAAVHEIPILILERAED
jgi:deazaflavin-dependent oxidoreductase (nitroreductase family)